MDQLIKNLRALIEKSEGDERKQYEDQLLDAIQKDAEEKAEAKIAEKAREAERMEKAKKADASEPKIEMGTGDRYKGVKVKEVMAKMASKAGERGADSYLKASPEGAEFVATFWIDKAIGAVNTKANELVTTTTTLGGNLTPTEQESAILDYVRHTSIALADADVIPMNSDVMTVPVAGTAPSVTIETGETSITQATPTFSLATLNSKRHSGYIPVSWELEADNNAGLVAYLADKFYEDLGKTIDSAVFLGPGTLVNGSGVMKGYGVSATMASAAFTSVTSAKVFETVGKLVPERRSGAKVYTGYGDLWTYLASLTYGTDMPMYNPMSNTLVGFPVRELNSAVGTGSGNPLFVLGNLKNFLVGSRLMNTQLKRIEEKTGMTNYVFFTRLAYSNPLPNGFAALVGA